MDAWTNEGVEQFLLDSSCHVEVATVALTADEVDYTLDTDVLLIRKLVRTDDPASPLEQRDPAEILAARAATNSSSLVTGYALQGDDLIMLDGTPATGDELLVYYVPRPTAMTTGTDVPQYIPTEWHIGPEYWAKMKAAESEGSKATQNGAYYRALYEDTVKRCRRHMNRKKGGPMLARVRPGRSSARIIPTSPGVDWPR
jgi:hypothetical protein